MYINWNRLRYPQPLLWAQIFSRLRRAKKITPFQEKYMNWNHLRRAGLRDAGAKTNLARKRRAKLRIYFEATSHFILEAKENIADPSVCPTGGGGDFVF